MKNYTQYSTLKNKRVFITGAATGIGAELVKAFVHQGAKVGFVDINQSSAISLLSEIENAGYAKPWFRAVDVSSGDDLKQTIHDFAHSHEGIDVLVNNVANDMRHSPQEVSEAEWLKCLQINLNAAFFASQAAFVHMKQTGAGAIINFSSLNAIIGQENMVGYTTAKAGLMGMTKSLAKDYGHKNVRVNAVLPGWVATEKQLNSWLTEEEEEKWMSQMAIKKRIYPTDVANLVLFLSADDSAMITGQNMAIDGGRS